MEDVRLGWGRECACWLHWRQASVPRQYLLSPACALALLGVSAACCRQPPCPGPSAPAPALPRRWTPRSAPACTTPPRCTTSSRRSMRSTIGGHAAWWEGEGRRGGEGRGGGAVVRPVSAAAAGSSTSRTHREWVTTSPSWSPKPPWCMFLSVISTWPRLPPLLPPPPQGHAHVPGIRVPGHAAPGLPPGALGWPSPPCVPARHLLCRSRAPAEARQRQAGQRCASPRPRAARPPPPRVLQAMAVDISLAALLGEDVYNFGELLLHPIVSEGHNPLIAGLVLLVGAEGPAAASLGGLGAVGAGAGRGESGGVVSSGIAGAALP